MKNILSLLIIAFTCLISTAQVHQVNFKLDYNSETKFYDMKIVFAAGEFDENNPGTFIPGNAQISFVTNSDTFEIIEHYNPVILASGIPITWTVDTQVSPSINGTDFSYYSIVPELLSSTYPSNLSIGDEVLIFSLKATSIDSCETSIRLWDNTLDTNHPTGEHMNQVFTMASSGFSQLYSSNSISNFGNAALTCFDETTELDEFSTMDNPTQVYVMFSDSCIEQTLSSNGYRTYITHQLDILDPKATTLHIGEGDDTFEPDFAIYEGEECSPKILVASIPDEDGNTYYYSSEDGNISNPHSIKINTNPLTGEPYSYWLAVGSNEELPNEDFEIFVANVYLSHDTVGIIGPDEICVGSTTQLTPNTGGMWSSSDAAIATVDNEGLVTGYNAGTATFYFTRPNGVSSETEVLTVFPNPVVSIFTTDIICIGSQAQLSPTTGGSWTGGNIATITDSGVATGLTLGTQEFFFTDNKGCVSDPIYITVTSEIQAQIGQTDLCIGQQTAISFSPTPDGYWLSDDEAIVTVTTSGEVTAIDEGITNISYYDENTDCPAIIQVRVFADQVIGFAGSDPLCIGETASIQSNTSAIWTSSNIGIATIYNNTEKITAVGAGETQLYGTAEGYCPSEPVTVVVNSSPQVSIDVNELCIGEATQAFPATFGSWSSSNFDIASITIGGLVTAVSPGQASFIFTDTNGCQSDPILVTVLPPLPITVPKDVIVIGETIQANAVGLTGNWDSSNYNIATVDENGVITGVNEGIVQIYLYEQSSCPGVITITVTNGMLTFKDQMIACYENEISFLNGKGTGEWTLISGPIIPIIENANDPKSLIYGLNTPGIYKFKWTTVNNIYETFITVGDDCDCDVRSNVIVPSSRDTYCINELIQIDALITAPPQNSALWEISMEEDFGNIILLSDSEYLSFVPIDENLGSGKYYLRRGWTGSDGCSSYSNCLTLFLEEEQITLQIQGEPVFCEGEDVSLQVEGMSGCSYTWTGPSGFTATGESIFIQGATVLNQGLYQVQADCINDCPSNIEEFELIMSTVEMPIVSSDTLCLSEVGTIGQPDGTIALYSSSDISVASVFQGNITPHSIGNVVFDATDENGCTSESVQVTIIDCDNVPCDGLNPLDIDIIGSVFIDSNENGIQDNIEGNLSNVMVTISELDISTITDDNGYFDFANLEAGNYTLVAQSNVGEWVESQLVLTDVITDGECTTEISFGFVPSGSVSADIQVVNTRRTRCDETVRFYVDFGNTGSEPLSGTVSVTFDDMTEYSVINNTGMLNGNTITWEYENLEPHDYKRVQFYLVMPAAESLPLPDLEFIGQFRDLDGNLLAEDILTTEIRCSFDPNDKTVNPDREGAENYLLPDEALDYTIRFQNNGNDTAYLVNIIDTLDENIDPRTLRVIDTSHPMSTSISGREVTFTFDDILLVDSMTNYAESTGYIFYSCKPYSGLEEFVIIENKADIIFDTNPPIVTNTTKNTFVEDLCFDILESSEEQTICAGQEYEGFSVSGTYTLELTTEVGCDSTHQIILHVLEEEINIENHVLCEGESVLINGITYNESGIYNDTLYSSEGCLQDIFNIHIDMTDSWVSQQSASICDGESYQGYTIAGTYMDSLTAISGCDSIIVLELEVVEAVYSENEIFACPFSTVIFNNVEYTEPGQYQDTLYGEGGCPTNIFDINIMLQEPIEHSVDTTICEGESYNGYSESGVYTYEVAGTSGCDSAVTINLNVLDMDDPLCLTNNDEVIDFGIEVYPNPSFAEVFITSPLKIEEVRLISTEGKLLYQNTNIKEMNDYRLDLRNISSGLYILSLDLGKTVVHKKVVIE